MFWLLLLLTINTAAATSPVCNEGWGILEANGCETCPSGTFSPAAMDAEDTDGNHCHPCAFNTYSDAGSGNCTTCLGNQISIPTRTKCIEDTLRLKSSSFKECETSDIASTSAGECETMWNSLLQPLDFMFVDGSNGTIKMDYAQENGIPHGCFKVAHIAGPGGYVYGFNPLKTGDAKFPTTAVLCYDAAGAGEPAGAGADAPSPAGCTFYNLTDCNTTQLESLKKRYNELGACGE